MAIEVLAQELISTKHRKGLSTEKSIEDEVLYIFTTKYITYYINVAYFFIYYVLVIACAWILQLNYTPAFINTEI